MNKDMYEVILDTLFEAFKAKRDLIEVYHIKCEKMASFDNGWLFEWATLCIADKKPEYYEVWDHFIEKCFNQNIIDIDVVELENRRMAITFDIGETNEA